MTTIDEKNHASRGHHPTSPSSLQVREASPCYIGRQSDTNDAAERGTKQHEAADKGEITDELTDEEALAVAQTLDAVAAAVEAMGGTNAIVLKENYWPVRPQEKVVDLNGHTWDGVTGGFADVVVVAPDWSAAIVLDWKFGRYSVEPAVSNLQGIAYAVGVFDKARRMGRKMREVTVAFFSPHINDWTQHTFKAEEVPQLLLRIETVVHRALATMKAIEQDPTDETRYHPRAGSCTFCGRIGVCPAVARIALKISEKYKPLKVPINDIRGFALTDPAIAQAGLQLGQVVTDWAKEYRKRVTDKAVDDERFIPDGYMLMVTYPRKVVDVMKMIEIAKELLPADEVHAMLDFPITPLEKAVKAKAARGMKTLEVEKLTDRLEVEGVTVKSPSPVVSLRMKSEKQETT